MENPKNKILQDVGDYYSAKLMEHGETAHGVDWNGEESQVLRFTQLTKIMNGNEKFSLNDLGCGYGALLDYLNRHYKDFVYTGYDISEEMISAARMRYKGVSNARFITSGCPHETKDYSVASGIFNVRLGYTDEQWGAHVEETIDALDRCSRYGFAFNCLTSYSDADKMRGDLYYADPCVLFDFCKRRYSRQVALLHDYGLYEFTLLVRKV